MKEREKEKVGGGQGEGERERENRERNRENRKREKRNREQRKRERRKNKEKAHFYKRMVVNKHRRKDKMRQSLQSQHKMNSGKDLQWMLRHSSHMASQF